MRRALTTAEERPLSPFSGSFHRSVALRLAARSNLPVLRCNSDSEAGLCEGKYFSALRTFSEPWSSHSEAASGGEDAAATAERRGGRRARGGERGEESTRADAQCRLGNGVFSSSG